MPTFRFIVLNVFAFTFLAFATEDKPRVLYDCGDATADEQYVLQIINRGRADPKAEGTRLKMDLTEGLVGMEKIRLEPLPPLAMNEKLLKLAREHSADMYARSYFDHTTPDLNGMPERFKEGKYEYTTIAENIAAGSRHSAAQLHDFLIIDAETPDRGHRKNLFGLIADTVGLREIGIGVHADKENNKDGVKLHLTEEFGTTKKVKPLLTGVVYKDANENGFYDPGEGLAGVTIKSDKGEFYAVTSASGGWVLPVPYGRVTLTVFGGDFESTATASVKVTGDNIEIDFILGKTDAIINFGKGEK